MTPIDANGTLLNVEDTGPRDGPALVLLHALGTDARLWAPILPRLPEGLRVIRPDMRGHGLSACPNAPYKMGTLVSDVEAVLDTLGIRGALVVGLSIGGMIAQALTVKRLDLVRALVLSNSAAKIGTPDHWHERIAATRANGLESAADATLGRWFPEPFRSSPKATLIRQMFASQKLEGWAGCAAAIAGTDLITPTSGLRLPTLAIAGSDDGSTPADMVRETADLIPGANFHLIRNAGHLPCIDAPRAYAEALTSFIEATGHLS